MTSPAERWGALPLGELHPHGKCALCGRAGSELLLYGDGALITTDAVGLKRTMLAYTRAAALVCHDVVACERRRHEQKRIAG